MAEFVETSAVIVDLLEESRLHRHLDVIGGGDIESAVAADPKIGLRRGDQRFGLGDEVALGQDRCTAHEMIRQAVALGDVEDGEAFQERNRFRFFARLLRALQLAFGDEAVGITNGGTVLAFADVAAEIERLPEGQPMLRREALLDDCAPEDQNIDAGIAPAGRGILGQAQAGLGATPRLNPRHAALLQLGDNLVGDLLIEAGLLFLSAAPLLTRRTHDLPSARSKTARFSPEAGWAAKCDRKGPT